MIVSNACSYTVKTIIEQIRQKTVRNVAQGTQEGYRQRRLITKATVLETTLSGTEEKKEKKGGKRIYNQKRKHIKKNKKNREKVKHNNEEKKRTTT